jgi:hypothetical protein
MARARHEYFPTLGQFLTKCQEAGYSLGMLIDLHPELGSHLNAGGRFMGLLKGIYPILMYALRPFSRRHYAFAIRCHFFRGFQEYRRSGEFFVV